MTNIFSQSAQLCHVMSKLKLDNATMNTLHEDANRDRSPGKLLAEFIMYRNYLEGRSPHLDEPARQGIRHRIDERFLLFAALPAADDLWLHMKMDLLSDAKPAIAANQNLAAMLSAAIEADIDRLCPVHPRFRLHRRAG
jgi:hypothetical protein